MRFGFDEFSKSIKYFSNVDQILKDRSTFEKILIVGRISIFNKNIDRPIVLTIHGRPMFLIKYEFDRLLKSFQMLINLLKFDQHLKNI